MDDCPQRPPLEPLVQPGAIDHHVADMTVTFAADVTPAALQRALAPHGQWLPFDGADHDDHPGGPTLGDLILRNSTGPLRLGYGAWRDVLLGAQFTNGTGDLITAGGRVLKNVAGYDLTKLLVGSHGVFGTPVSFTVRTWKRPEAGLQMSIETPRLPPEALVAGPLRPQWAIREGDGHTVLGYLGDTAAIEAVARRVESIGPARVDRCDIETDARARARRWPILAATARVSVPPARVEAFLTAAGLAQFAADPVHGLILPEPSTEPARLRAAARHAGGTVAFFDPRGVPEEMCVDPAAYALLRRLKTAFDPNDTLPALPRNAA